MKGTYLTMSKIILLHKYFKKECDISYYFPILHLDKGSFNKNIDKKGWVGGQLNVFVG